MSRVHTKSFLGDIGLPEPGDVFDGIIDPIDSIGGGIGDFFSGVGEGAASFGKSFGDAIGNLTNPVMLLAIGGVALVILLKK